MMRHSCAGAHSSGANRMDRRRPLWDERANILDCLACSSHLLHLTAGLYFNDVTFLSLTDDTSRLDKILGAANVFVILLSISLFVLTMIENAYKMDCVALLSSKLGHLVATMQVELRKQRHELCELLRAGLDTPASLTPGARISHAVLGEGTIKDSNNDVEGGTSLYVIFDSGVKRSYETEVAQKRLTLLCDEQSKLTPDAKISFRNFKLAVESTLGTSTLTHQRCIEALFLTLKLLDGTEDEQSSNVLSSRMREEMLNDSGVPMLLVRLRLLVRVPAHAVC